MIFTDFLCFFCRYSLFTGSTILTRRCSSPDDRPTPPHSFDDPLIRSEDRRLLRCRSADQISGSIAQQHLHCDKNPSCAIDLRPIHLKEMNTLRAMSKVDERWTCPVFKSTASALRQPNYPGKKLSETVDLFQAYKFETGVDAR